MTPRPVDPHIGLVVEGRGDEIAVPLVARAWLQARGEYRDVVGKPVPCHGREKAIQKGGLERFVATAAARPGCVGVLCTLDAEDDAACALGPDLLARVSGTLGKDVVVALCEPKFEAWLVASAETMELPGLEYDAGRDPEGLIKRALRPRKYIKPTWQPRLATRVDFDRAAERCPDLSRWLAKLEALAALLP